MKIGAIAAIAVFGIYGIGVSVMQFLKGGDGIFNGIGTLFVGFVFCLIVYLSFFGKWGAFLRKFGGARHGADADALDAAYEASTVDKSGWYSESEEFKKEMRERRKREYKEKKFKFKKACIAPCLICIIGSAVCFAIAGAEISKIYGDVYVKAQAEIINYVTDDGKSRLVFQIIENGKTYITAGADSWSGVDFIAGNTVTVYHPALHPEVVWQPSTAIMLCAGGVMLLVMSLVIFMAIHGMTGYVGLPVGLIFTGMCIAVEVSIGIAGGFTFFQITFSGAFVCAANGLLGFGVLFICIGCINVYRRFTGDELL